MNNYYYRFKVAYKGTHFNGWQIQKGSEKTVQGEILGALATLCKSSDIKILGAGRTDAGVHALGQIFRAELPISLPYSALIKGVNSLLPKDVKILDVEVCDRSFRPIHDVIWKEYNYYFCIKDKPGPFLQEYVGHCPYELDLSLIEKGCKIFVGTHDFCNFYCVGSKISSTVRTIFHCELLTKVSPGPWGFQSPPFYVIRVVGKGFLKQMVRLIVGSLWSLGRGKITLEDIEMGLVKRASKKLGVVAPSEGLYLKEVNYSTPYSMKTVGSE